MHHFPVAHLQFVFQHKKKSFPVMTVSIFKIAYEKNIFYGLKNPKRQPKCYKNLQQERIMMGWATQPWIVRSITLRSNVLSSFHGFLLPPTVTTGLLG